MHLVGVIFICRDLFGCVYCIVYFCVGVSVYSTSPLLMNVLVVSIGYLYE